MREEVAILCYNRGYPNNETAFGADTPRAASEQRKGLLSMPTSDSTSKTIQIPLTKGFIATVDLVDGDLARHRWCVKTPRGYARRRVNRVEVLMHRIILARMMDRELVKGEFVDHIDGNGLNNRRSNLRLATNQQNQQNRLLDRRNTSGYKGVSWNKKSKGWRAQIVVNGQTVWLGLFDTPEAAHEAYCGAAREYFGEFARLS